MSDFVPRHIRDDHIKAYVSSQTETGEGSLFRGNTQPNTLLTKMYPGSDTNPTPSLNGQALFRNLGRHSGHC